MANPSEPFGVVGPPYWDDAPVFIVGAGPSLIGYDLGPLRGEGYLLGVNRIGELFPVAGSFSLDRLFIERFPARAPGDGYGETYFAIAPEWFRDGRRRPSAGVTYIERRAGPGLSTDPRGVVNGLTSGYGALNLAVLKRASEIYLLGFDLNPVGGDAPRRWHAGYAWSSVTTEKYWDRWAARFDDVPGALPAGVRVYNANPRSAIRAFPFVTYKDLGL